MPGPAWWYSFDKMDAVFRAARQVAIAAITLGAACWIGGVPLVAIVAAIAGTTAIVIMLFSWFRRDDLLRTGGDRP